jgi:hypothetical protein
MRRRNLFSGFGGRKGPSSMGTISTAEVLRLRATSAVSRDESVRRFAQDDDSVGVLKKNIPTKGPQNRRSLGSLGMTKERAAVP